MSYSVNNHKLRVGASNAEFVRSPNIGGILVPQFLVIHYTASGPGSDIAKYFSSPAANVSAHLVVRRDGTIKQCVPFNVVGWHAGKSSWRDRRGVLHVGLNQSSIGIEIENWGPLHKAGAGWVSWTKVPVDSGSVIEATHKYGSPSGGWEAYGERQIDSVIGAARAICDAYGIEEIVGHDDIAPGRKSDPGPAWNMKSFIARVQGRDSGDPDFWVVNSPTGLNLRDGASASAALKLPAPLPNGTRVQMLEASGNWRYVSVLDALNVPTASGWVHGAYLRDI